MKNEIILFETEDKSVTLPVQVSSDTVWLNRSQLAELFGRDIKTIGKHIGNALREELEESEVVAKFATTTRHGAKDRCHDVLYFLDKNGILFSDGEKLIDDHTLVALTIMIAESRPEEKEIMINVIMNCIV